MQTSIDHIPLNVLNSPKLQVAGTSREVLIPQKSKSLGPSLPTSAPQMVRQSNAQNVFDCNVDDLMETPEGKGMALGAKMAFYNFTHYGEIKLIADEIKQSFGEWTGDEDIMRWNILKSRSDHSLGCPGTPKSPSKRTWREELAMSASSSNSPSSFSARPRKDCVVARLPSKPSASALLSLESIREESIDIIYGPPSPEGENNSEKGEKEKEKGVRTVANNPPPPHLISTCSKGKGKGKGITRDYSQEEQEELEETHCSLRKNGARARSVGIWNWKSACKRQNTKNTRFTFPSAPPFTVGPLLIESKTDILSPGGAFLSPKAVLQLDFNDNDQGLCHLTSE